MTQLHFLDSDVQILYSIPNSGATIARIVFNYTFINRDAPPTYERFFNCISRALKVGCIEVDSDEIALTDEWHNRFSDFNDSSSNEFESMEKATNFLLKSPWDIKNDYEYLLDKETFKRAVQESLLPYGKWDNGINPHHNQ